MTETTHARLIKDLWPDKALYGAVILFITGVSGISFAVFSRSVDISYSEKVPSFVQGYPPTLTLLFSALAIFFAYRSLKTRSLVPAFLGVASGVLSFGMAGVCSLLAVVSLFYTFLAKREKEDTKPETLLLTADRWPDKSLAASLLFMMSGLVTLAWGSGIFSNVVRTEIDNQQLFGLCAILVGLISLYASIELYFQRAFWIGVLAGWGGLFVFGFYIVGPMLSGAALVLVFFAWREREFQAAHREPHASPGARA